MKTFRNTTRIFIACAMMMMMVFGIAHAGSGLTMTQAKEALIEKGMSVEEIQQALGQPSKKVHYDNVSGAT